MLPSDVTGALGGRAAAAASPVTVPATSSSAAGGLDVMVSTVAGQTVGTEAKSGHPPSVGAVTEFVLEADDASSATGDTVAVIAVNGTTVATVTLGASDTRAVASAGLVWTPSDTYTATPTDGGHKGVTLYAATSRVR